MVPERFADMSLNYSNAISLSSEYQVLPKMQPDAARSTGIIISFKYEGAVRTCNHYQPEHPLSHSVVNLRFAPKQCSAVPYWFHFSHMLRAMASPNNAGHSRSSGGGH